MKLDQLTVAGYLDELASDAPAPGGGAAAGLTGAQAAALLAMTGNLSRGEKYAGVADQIDEIVQFCDMRRERLVALTHEDADAFEQLLEALRSPRANEAERNARKALVQERLRAAARVPLAIMEETVRLATPASILAEIGNKQLTSDIAVALALIEGALLGARLNVLVNLKQIGDREFVERTSNAMGALLEQFREQKRACMLAIEEELPGAAT